ncbi:MAG: alpha/beta fold hydrolase [Actinomycetota bacterium]
MATFLLIHGACHGGWCWDHLVSHLSGRGHTAVAPDLPCEDPAAGLSEYADVATAALEGRTDEVVVVGHSLGALTAPIVTTRVPVRRLVFVAGIIGAPGKSLAQLAEMDADRDLPLGDGVETNADGLFRFTEAGARRLLFHDCVPEVAQWAATRLRYQRSMWNEAARFEAWPDTEIVPITCTDDRIVNRSWSERVASMRFGVEPVLLQSGHSPFLSRPEMLADILTAGLTR